PAWACVGGEVAVAEVVDEAKLGRVARLRQRQLEAPLAEVVLRGEGEVPGWVATLDRHVGPGLALLVEHLEPHGLAGAGVSFPAPDPAGGALGVGDARPDIVDRCAERARQDQVVATDVAGGFGAHAVSFFFSCWRSRVRGARRPPRFTRWTSVSSAMKRRSQRLGACSSAR